MNKSFRKESLSEVTERFTAAVPPNNVMFKKTNLKYTYIKIYLYI